MVWVTPLSRMAGVNKKPFVWHFYARQFENLDRQFENFYLWCHHLIRGTFEMRVLKDCLKISDRQFQDFLVEHARQFENTPDWQIDRDFFWTNIHPCRLGQIPNFWQRLSLRTQLMFYRLFAMKRLVEVQLFIYNEKFKQFYNTWACYRLGDMSYQNSLFPRHFF